MADPRDTLDLSGRPAEPSQKAEGKTGPASEPGSYLRIFFACSNTYARAQRTPAGDAYTARCPSCGQTKRFLVGEGGTSQRSFILSCR